MVAAYRLTDAEMITRTADCACIPRDPANQDYQAFLDWQEAGNVPDPYVAPAPPVPVSCSKLGLKRAFDELGTWPAIKAAIAADPIVEEEWDLATEIRRSDRLVQHMIAVVALTDSQVDNLLIRANALV